MVEKDPTNTEQQQEDDAGVVAELIAPVAKLRRRSDKSLVIELEQPMTQRSPRWLHDLNQLILQLNDSITRGDQLVVDEGRLRAIESADDIEGLEALKYIVKTQTNGRVHLQRTLPAGILKGSAE